MYKFGRMGTGDGGGGGGGGGDMRRRGRWGVSGGAEGERVMRYSSSSSSIKILKAWIRSRRTDLERWAESVTPSILRHG